MLSAAVNGPLRDRLTATCDSLDCGRISIDSSGSSATGTYQVVVVDSDNFTFDITTPINSSDPTTGTVEFTNYGRKWETAIKIENSVQNEEVYRSRRWNMDR